MTRNITRVVIVETDVYGVKGYKMRCMECDEESKCFDRKATAVKKAKAHRCSS